MLLAMPAAFGVVLTRFGGAGGGGGVKAARSCRHHFPHLAQAILVNWHAS